MGSHRVLQDKVPKQIMHRNNRLHPQLTISAFATDGCCSMCKYEGAEFTTSNAWLVSSKKEEVNRRR